MKPTKPRIGKKFTDDQIIRKIIADAAKFQPTTRREWEDWIGGRDKIIAELFELFNNAEKFATKTPLEDEYAEARRKYALYIIKDIPPDERKKTHFPYLRNENCSRSQVR